MLRDSLILAKRSVIKMVRNPEQFIDVTLQPIILTVVFVFIFGGAIAGSTGEYVQFALPGIIVQTIMFTSLTIGVNLNTDIQKGIFDRFRSLPIARSSPLFGAVLGDIVRHSIAITVTLLFGRIIGFEFPTPWWHVAIAVLLIITFAVSLCWVSVLIGMLARSSGAVQGLSFLIVFPLTFGSSTFVPASTLPTWLQGWVAINPVTHVIESMRGLLTGSTGVVGDTVTGQVLWVLASCVVLVGVFFPLATWAYRRKI
ncbi:ABC transporter permease [Subtercola boreus]|uniref:Transport permease protein n=1 Tax=Subtercola boreus TaxID=120213 RepID=A0A3E0W6X0_9MICO|nr:ABC transporter permease [Subtercola boreus]RFA18221.1 ABC transporter [Subtercola boreus]RFA18613.1 ABC transporter [Subtercola boreus]RFA25217.1 ABC transporter [Subtercola boreus]